MKKIFVALLAVSFLAPQINAQVSHGGQPLNWELADLENTVSFVRTPELDMETIAAEDAENDQYKEFGFRFGIEHAVNLNTATDGAWTTVDKKHVWRLGIQSPNAKGISVLFEEFDIPKGANLFIYDEEKTHFIGSFNHTNKQANGMLATTLVYGEKIIVELQVPSKYAPSSVSVKIGQIVHAYRGLDSKFEELKQLARGPFGSSGSCNIGINCPEGDDWQVEKKSVALIASGGSAVCSGALINNTANDGFPYFLTANHCLGGGVGNWTFYFNHEASASSCNGNSGPTNNSVSGATLLASNGGSDFALLEINNGNSIPANFNAEWAGWDNTDNESAVTAATGIHHPSGDLKKICHDTDGPYHDNVQGAAVWYIDQWEDGMTEGGSSGSPLFNQDHKIIGQLYGGSASCQNQAGADWYGRLGVSWDGSSSSTRLRDWLDPTNSGVTTLDGYPTGSVVYNIDAASSGLINVPDELCAIENVTPTFVLKNNGVTTLTSCTISYSYNSGSNQTINWTGNLSQNATENVQLSSFTPTYGTNAIEVTVSSPNGQIDENGNNNSSTRNFEVKYGEQSLNLTLETDNYGYEIYWEVRGPSNQVLASGGNSLVGPNGGGNQDAQPGDPGAYANNTTINETIQLNGDGCYTFLIVDDYGDGICCDFFGNGGAYELRDANNLLMASGGEFENDDATEFGMIGGVSVAEANFGQVRVYPNPTEGSVFIDIEKAEELVDVQIMDLTGRIVRSENATANNRISIDLSGLSDGVYHVNLNSISGRLVKRIILLND